jgi:cysteine desulfurase family protein (TIGR01976 family)
MNGKLEWLFAGCRVEFPGLSRATVHLNNAAGSEMPERAVTAMAQCARAGFSNEGIVFYRLWQSGALAEAAHARTAAFLNAHPDEVGLGASTTTNLFMVSRALARTWSRGDKVLVSEACHEANIAPWLYLRHEGIEVDVIPMKDDTRLDYEWLERALDAKTRLVAVGASSNATGTLHDIGRVVRLSKRVGALVSLDAAHYAPHRAIDVTTLGVDLLFFSIYKCFGPHLGAYWIRRGLVETLQPPMDLGGPRRARGLETGTKAFEALAGWLGTLDYLESLGRAAAPLLGETADSAPAALRVAMNAISDWEGELTRYADAALAKVPGLVCYRDPAVTGGKRLGVFSVNVKGREPVVVARALEAAGVEAVMSHNGAPRTLKRLAPEFGGVAIRLSIAHYSSRADIDAAVKCLEGLAKVEKVPGTGASTNGRRAEGDRGQGGAGERPAPQRRGREMAAAARRGSPKRGQSRLRKRPAKRR